MQSPGMAPRILVRSLRLRCPRCGQGAVLSGGFSTNAACPVCGLRFQREEGYWIGAIYVNLITTQFLIIGGLFALMFLGALGSIPDDIFNAARIDGANSWRIFRSITLPLLRPVLLIVTLLKIISSLRMFDQGPGHRADHHRSHLTDETNEAANEWSERVHACDVQRDDVGRQVGLVMVLHVRWRHRHHGHHCGL